MLTKVLELSGIKKEDLYGGLLAWLTDTYTDVKVQYDIKHRLHNVSAFIDTARTDPAKIVNRLDLSPEDLNKIKPQGEC